MDILSKKRIVKPAAALIAAAAAVAPGATAEAKQSAHEHHPRTGPVNVRIAYDHAYERTYIEVRRKVVKRFDAETAGRNIVRDGFREKDGDVRGAHKDEVVESTKLMRSWLEPAAGQQQPAGSPSADAGSGSYETAGAPTSVVQCESGGNYGAVNPAGYYGAYQFDQSTWDAYAPDGYAGTNPAAAPPAVQDAAAAAVPYDAWPNC